MEEKLQELIRGLIFKSIAAEIIRQHSARIDRISQEQAAEIVKRGDEHAGLMFAYLTRQQTAV
jgi:hypothetical protein